MYDSTKWRLVPVDPTDAMIQAGIDAPLANTGEDAVDQPQDYRNVYGAMIGAAPNPVPPLIQTLHVNGDRIATVVERQDVQVAAMPANQETPETLPEGHKIDWSDAAIPTDSPYGKYAMTLQTELTASYGLHHEIIDSAGFDAYAERAKAQGYKESYAICITVDGTDYEFPTMADFKAALVTGCAKESVGLYALPSPGVNSPKPTPEQLEHFKAMGCTGYRAVRDVDGKPMFFGEK